MVSAGNHWRRNRYTVVALVVCALLLLVSLPILQGLLATDGYYGHHNRSPVPAIDDAPVPSKGVNVVFFGFSGCAQTCPLQLANLMALERLVDPDKVQFVYVALDAEQQDQTTIDAAMRERSPVFTGVVPANVSAAKELVRAYGGFASERGEAVPDRERFDHDGRLYVVTDANVRALTYLKPTLEIEKVADDITKLLNNEA